MKPLRATLALGLVAAAGFGGYVALNGWPAGVPSFGLAEAAPSGEQGRDGEGGGEPPAPVVLADVTAADIAITVEAVGDAVARESVVVTSRVSGRVEEIAFTDGQDVSAGDILVRLDPADAEDEVRVAEAAAREALQGFRRAQDLAEREIGPQAVADDLRRQAEAAEAQVASARERLDDYNVRAPFDGRLGLRTISLGALIQPGAEIALLDAIDPIEIRFTVPERFLGEVRQGAKVFATSPAYPERRFAGEVTAIASRVDPALRTVTVEATIPNADEALLPGMLMNVTLELGLKEDATIAPPLAVQLQGASHFLFRVAEGKAERVEVEIGQRAPDGVEIVSGLEPGERVVVEGFQDLQPGQPVEERPPARAPPAPEQAAASPAATEG